ncbi:putative Deacetylase, histone deacetylase family [Nitrospina gracilis 3/211]|uniref:Putative Deacetylase, histone deacetylase family n=1 Tax=Nitrospina gracilis (strain 3/211) TaxID=1266370 RepID=M1YYL6_NITG3|nr:MULTISPECIES: histone deacetylase [Nitrospina]MCF8723301.1 acetoin utilization deacetylase AcuC-like enzyme [Nitrospina sp. Nb-3]CCQ90351.1 putative Deacetylase, histone deacetylase family [Nitrospina gracilis 3/211]
MKKTGYIYHPLFLEHETGSHPENPGRLRAITQKLEESGLASRLPTLEPRPATAEEIALNHPEKYMDSVARACESGMSRLDMDTAISTKSYDSALLAAGAGLTAVDAVVDGACDNVFCAVRPPGHHAEETRSMGFCLFNNVAVAARYALAKKDLNRVFIFDWDVHHGNGTQHSFYADPNIYYSSTHQFPFYPGTGDKDETGTGDGLGTTLNFPMRAFSNDADYISVVKDKLVPEMFRFKPDLIIISSGFDAHEDDPLANVSLTTECFGEMTRLIRGAADEICRGRLISMLEGGYNYEALADSVYIHLENLLS